MEGLGSLTLIVKAPNQRIGDQRVACDRTWTVRQLKEHLSSVHPEKPHKDKQKLVYFGKLLKDESCLQEVLTQDCYDDAHTVHLVCPSQSLPDTLKASYIARYSTASPPQVNELRQRLATPVSDQVPTPQQTPASPDFTHQWNSNWAQMLAMQAQQQSTQMTAQQQLWLTLYQQQMQQWQQYNGLFQQQWSSQQVAAESAAAPQQEEAVADPQQPAEQDDIVRMNAQGGMDADGQQDWLDTIYTIVRFAMLMLLLFFYTTFGRFAIVIVVGVFFYVAQGNLFGNLFRLQRRRPAARPAPPQPQQNEQNQAENQNNENSERYQNESGTAEPNNNTVIPQQNAATWLDGVKLILTFFVTFFTSLIPQNPAAIAN